MPQVVTIHKIHITLNQDNPTDQALWQRIRHEFEAAPPPVPTPTLPVFDPVTHDLNTPYRVTDWTQDIQHWIKVCSPEDLGANTSTLADIRALSPDTLSLRIKAAQGKQAGARLGIGADAKWDHFNSYLDTTLDFHTVFTPQQMLPQIEGQGNGWCTLGWQMKVWGVSGENAAIAMNVHQSPEGQLRWYLQGNKGLKKPVWFHDPTFPPIEIGKTNEVHLIYHCSSDVTKGFAELHFNGKVLKATGQTINANGGLAPYLTLYGEGIDDAEVLVGETRISVVK